MELQKHRVKRHEDTASCSLEMGPQLRGEPEDTALLIDACLAGMILTGFNVLIKSGHCFLSTIQH